MIRSTFVLVLWLVASLACHGQALQSPPSSALMYIDNNSTSTSDQTVILLYKRPDQSTPIATKSVVLKNDQAVGGPGLLVTLEGSTTSATPTVDVTNSSILVRPGESVAIDGQYKVMHYRWDSGIGAGGMRAILVY